MKSTRGQMLCLMSCPAVSSPGEKSWFNYLNISDQSTWSSFHSWSSRFSSCACLCDLVQDTESLSCRFLVLQIGIHVPAPLPQKWEKSRKIRLPELSTSFGQSPEGAGTVSSPTLASLKIFKLWSCFCSDSWSPICAFSEVGHHLASSSGSRGPWLVPQ